MVATLALNGLYVSSGQLCYEALAALFDYANAPVASTAVSREPPHL